MTSPAKIAVSSLLQPKPIAMCFNDAASEWKIHYFCATYDFSMFVTILKSKLHRVRVTQAELNYVGSITIDEDLMEAAGILENEQVHIVNNNNGERLITYVIKGERGTGIICLNGAAARRAQVGDIIIIISYAMMTTDEARTHKPTVIFPDDNNRLIKG
jgi:aspartate 1-decarboxylase